MASGKGQAEASRRMAAYMKEKGIKRTQGRCGVCCRMVSLPMDSHLFNCKGPRRKGK